MTHEEAITALRDLLLENGCNELSAETLAHEYAEDMVKVFPDVASMRKDFAAVEGIVARIASAELGLAELEARGKIH